MKIFHKWKRTLKKCVRAEIWTSSHKSKGRVWGSGVRRPVRSVLMGIMKDISPTQRSMLDRRRPRGSAGFAFHVAGCVGSWRADLWLKIKSHCQGLPHNRRLDGCYGNQRHSLNAAWENQNKRQHGFSPWPPTGWHCRRTPWVKERARRVSQSRCRA